MSLADDDEQRLVTWLPADERTAAAFERLSPVAEPTIDPEPEYQQAAREAFAAADVPLGRTRLINGSPIEVLPRLADESYELVFLDGEVLDHPRYLADAVRILRPGGVVVLHHAGALDPGHTGPVADAVREAALIVADDDRFLPVVIPLGAGILAAAKAR